MKNRSLFALFLLFSLAAKSQSAGPLPAGRVLNSTAAGTIGWTNVLNTQLNDNAYASAGQSLGVLASATSNYLILDSFGFNIPGTALITGIQVTRLAYVDGLLIGSSAKDNVVELLKNDVVGGTNRASASAWPSSEGLQTYGGSSDTWGLTLTPADVNAPGFGIAMSVKLNSGLASLFLTANIDQVSVTVFYTNSVVLPLVMGEFTARPSMGTVDLDWTADPGSGSLMLVECQHDNQSWITLDTVPATDEEGMRNYHAVDRHPGIHNYYRIELITRDHAVSFSPTIAAVLDQAAANLEIYPNPTRSDLFVRHDGHLQSVSLLNMQGGVIPVTSQETGDGLSLLRHPPLAPGIYIVRVRKDGVWYSRQVIFDAPSGF
jgi:hypothetical protein